MSLRRIDSKCNFSWSRSRYGTSSVESVSVWPNSSVSAREGSKIASKSTFLIYAGLRRPYSLGRSRLKCNFYNNFEVYTFAGGLNKIRHYTYAYLKFMNYDIISWTLHAPLKGIRMVIAFVRINHAPHPEPYNIERQDTNKYKCNVCVLLSFFCTLEFLSNINATFSVVQSPPAFPLYYHDTHWEI